VLARSIPGHTSDTGTQEEALEIEYIESVMPVPPTKLATLPHEEWVSSISCSIPGSASFDYRYYYYFFPLPP